MDVINDLLHIKVWIHMWTTAALSDHPRDVLLYPARLIDDVCFRLFALLEKVYKLTLEIEQ